MQNINIHIITYSTVNLAINTPAQTQNRKADHIRICLENNVQSPAITTGLEKYRFTHTCLPELNGQDIDVSTTFLGKHLHAIRWRQDSLSDGIRSNRFVD